MGLGLHANSRCPGMHWPACWIRPVWAPNHRLTEPWRFFHSRERECGVREGCRAGIRFRPAARAPTNVAPRPPAIQPAQDPRAYLHAYSTPGRDEEGTRENYASVCCAAQNMALAGVAEGLSVTWETGGPTRHPDLAKARWGPRTTGPSPPCCPSATPPKTPTLRAHSGDPALYRWLD